MNDVSSSARFSHWQTRALILGIIFAIVAIIGAVLDRSQFFQSYLLAWLFWSGLSFGALVIVMMQFVTGGLWGAAVRELAFAAIRNLPLMAMLFLPVLLGVHHIYGWANGANGETAGYHHKAQYLNVPFFAARSIVYFLVLIVIGFLLRRWSDQRRTATVALSAGGLIVYVLCMNFASTDWVMSLDPEWYSTIFVEVFAAGQFLSALALVTVLLAKGVHVSLEEPVATKAFHDLGNMLLAFTIFWTYVSFSQLLIIWSGNLPKEISWYLERSRGGWQWLAFVLAATQFLLPFFLLLSRAAKRDPARLARICLLILVANVINNFWLIAPSFHPDSFHLHWLDFVDLIAVGGIWFASFFYFLKGRPPAAATIERELQHA